MTVLPALRARADVLIDTIGLPSAGADIIAPASLVTGGGGPIADSFSVGPQSVQLGSVTVVLAATNNHDGGAMVVSLWTDNPTGDANGNMPAPGSLVADLATVSDSSLSPTFSDVVIGAPGLIALTANNRYWIEVANASPSAITSGEWDYAASTSALTVANSANEYNWGNYSGYTNTSFADASNGVDLFAVSTPEPDSIALLGFGLLLLGLLRGWPLRVSRP